MFQNKQRFIKASFIYFIIWFGGIKSFGLRHKAVFFCTRRLQTCMPAGMVTFYCSPLGSAIRLSPLREQAWRKLKYQSSPVTSTKAWHGSKFSFQSSMMHIFLVWLVSVFKQLSMCTPDLLEWNPAATVALWRRLNTPSAKPLHYQVVLYVHTSHLQKQLFKNHLLTGSSRKQTWLLFFTVYRMLNICY